LLLALTVSIPAHAQEKEFPRTADVHAEQQDSFSWTGLYLGGNGGFDFPHYDMDESSVVFTDFHATRFEYPVPGLSKTKESFIGGGQIGYNYQLGHLVLGLEGDFDGISSNKVMSKYFDGLNPPAPDEVKGERAVEMDWNASARLRAGFAWGHFLLYATGGGAFAQLHIHAEDSLTDLVTNDVRSLESSSENTVTGWTAGGGAEWAVTKWISVGLEYRHSDFGGKDNYHFASTPEIRPQATKVGLDEDQVTLRVNLLVSGLMGR
jgi:outer membrane immunogenic protein